MLYRRRESEATLGQMWCPPCLLCGTDAKLRADKPVTGCSMVGEDTEGMGLHSREPRREGRCSGGVLRRRQWPTITTCRFRQGRQDSCSYRGQETSPQRPEEPEHNAGPIQTWGPSLMGSTPGQYSQFPRHSWRKGEGQKATRLSKRVFSENLSNS